MVRIIFGIFIVLHGLVHLLYFGHSARYFELQPGLSWPDGAWAFSGFMGTGTVRMVGNILLVLAALLFVVGGIAVFTRQDWWRLAVTISTVFSTAVYLLLWNGRFERLADNGWVGILINLAVLAVIYIFSFV